MKQEKSYDELVEDYLLKKRKLKRDIRSGKLPRWILAKGNDLKLERTPHPKLKGKMKLTWRMISVEEAIL